MDTRLLDATNPETFRAAIAAAADLIAAGGIVAFPTETVYGLGASALDARAIGRVFAAKGRPADNPLIVHVADVASVALCAVPDDRVEALARAFMPGPLTVVLRSLDTIPPIARAGLATVAVRIPDHPVALRLLEMTGPLVGPSANLSGRPSPTTAAHVLADLSGTIDAVLDGGVASVGIESTVLDLSHETPLILRPGRISAAEIAEVLHAMPGTADAHALHRSPGTRYRHYAPHATVRLVIGPAPPLVEPGAAHELILTTPRHARAFAGCDVETLSEARLYASLREADERGVERITVYAEPGELPEGLLDRVLRASNSFS